MKLNTLFLFTIASAVLFNAATLSAADEPDNEKAERQYSKSFADEDLTGKSFANQNLDNCNFENADLTDATFEGASLKNCNFRGAMMKNTELRKVDLTGSEFQEAVLEHTKFTGSTLNKVNFEGLDLSKVQLYELKLRGANLRNVKAVWYVYGSDFFAADLRGANFSSAIDFTPANFRKAKYDQFTRWHEGFDPDGRGAIYEEMKEEPVAPKAQPATDKTALETAFTKLDANMDGVLSGNETKTCKECDSDADGEVTLAEFLAGK